MGLHELREQGVQLASSDEENIPIDRGHRREIGFIRPLAFRGDGCQLPAECSGVRKFGDCSMASTTNCAPFRKSDSFASSDS
jgi:hypothetical protein